MQCVCVCVWLYCFCISPSSVGTYVFLLARTSLAFFLLSLSLSSFCPQNCCLMDDLFVFLCKLLCKIPVSELLNPASNKPASVSESKQNRSTSGSAYILSLCLSETLRTHTYTHYQCTWWKILNIRKNWIKLLVACSVAILNSNIWVYGIF